MTTSQKRGALLLLAILVALAGWRWRVATLNQEKQLPEVEEAQLDPKPKGEGAVFESLDSATKQPPAKLPARKKIYVDLNTADATELQSVKGIGPVFAERIVKYRQLRHGFSEKAQLQEVYGIEEEQYAGIAPQVYVDTNSEGYQALQKKEVVGEEIEEEREEQVKPQLAWEDQKEEQEMPARININTADSAALDQVPGIGPSTAANILKYRRLIFFFHSSAQLDEVWGIRPENKEKMLPFLEFGTVDAAFPHLMVNSATKDELAQHKYLGFKEAGILVAYREQHGDFSSVEDLRQVIGLKAETLEKIIPYLRF